MTSQEYLFQPKVSIHTYGVLPTAVLSRTYSEVRQQKYELT